jgi:natural product precursor
MKTLNKIKLNNLSAENLSDKQMKEIKGGNDPYCYCSCYYAQDGGSGTDDNCFANQDIPSGKSSYGTFTAFCWEGIETKL